MNRKIELKPITKKEKQDPTLIPYPISLRYLSPLPNDFFGVNFPDLLQDKQAWISTLINLEKIRAIKNAFGEDKFFDPDKIQDINKLLEPSETGKYIELSLEPWESPRDAVYSVPKDNSDVSVPNMIDRLNYEGTQSTWVDPNTMGIGSWQSRTLGESKIIQQNANLSFGLITLFFQWADESFWTTYHRSLMGNLSGERSVRVKKAFGNDYIRLSGSEVRAMEDVGVEIVSTKELEGMREGQKNEFFASYAQFKEGAKSQSVRNYLDRKLLRLQGVSQDEINFLVRDSLDERIAKIDVDRLNYKKEPLPIKAWQDHLTFITYYETAIDSEVKRKAIRNRQQALLYEGVMMDTPQDDQVLKGQANASASQLTNAVISQNSGNNSTPSLQDIAQQW